MAVNLRPVRVMVQAVGIAIFAPADPPTVDRVVLTDIVPIVTHPVAVKAQSQAQAIVLNPMTSLEIAVPVRLMARIISIEIVSIAHVHRK